MAQFKCIYCQKYSPNIKPSISHIIPEAFGKGPILKIGVCACCNGYINKKVESLFIKATSPLRSLLAIKGKRGKPSFKAKAKFGDAQFDITLRHPKDLEERLFFFKNVTGKEGKKKIAIIGCGSKFYKAQKKYETKHKQTEWEGIAGKDRKIDFEFVLNLGSFFSVEALRLAAKIAFELYCSKRPSEVVEGYEFDAIREFIRYGKYERNAAISNVTIDPAILRGLGNIPLGIHSVYLDYNMASRKIVSIVGLFGLVYYKVILTRYANIFVSSNELFLFNPQRGQYQPILLLSMGRPNIHRPSRYDRLTSQEALKRHHEELLTKLNTGFKEIYRKRNGSIFK